MGKINYQKIYDRNRKDWLALTEDPQKYEALLDGHYSDSNHFIYELLQNAEDERATKAIIEYYDDKLVFYHNGDPFDEDDVIGVSSMLMGTKDRNSGQTIGRFGMGFKSVFKYTHRPEIYSDDEAFVIQNFLLPVEITEKWDYQEIKKHLQYNTGAGKGIRPFAQDNHLTKIVIPFEKKNMDGSVRKISGAEVLDKLKSLDGQILLFLTYIKNLYWINTTNKEFAYITLDVDGKDNQLITCKMSGTSIGPKESVEKYLKYTYVFNHPEMDDASVSIAFKINTRGGNINELSDSRIFVYFPTKDNISLPFLVHGSFETAVSREKLMEPSAFNEYLFLQIVNLFCRSIMDLKRRNLITQAFARKILVASFNEPRLSDLKQEVTELFKKESLVPDSNGKLCSVENLYVPVPFEIANFRNLPIFKDSFEGYKPFAALNDEKGPGFVDYYNWLVEDLNIEKFTLFDWARALKLKTRPAIVKSGTDSYRALQSFYMFIKDYRESVMPSNIIRAAAYEAARRESIEGAWDVLKQAPIILTMSQRLTSAWKNNSPNVYLASDSHFKKQNDSAIVDRNFAEKFKDLFTDGFEVSRFDNFQFVKEKVIKKYIEGDSVNFDNEEDFEKEYIEDLKQIHSLFDGRCDSEVQNMLKEAYFIKIINPECPDEDRWITPNDAYLAESNERVDLTCYLDKVSDKYPVDIDFYESHGIFSPWLKDFGVFCSIVNCGQRNNIGIANAKQWEALGEYCPNLTIAYLRENLEYISKHSKEDISKNKSASILYLLLDNYKKLSGQVRYNKTNKYTKEEACEAIRTINWYKWLYNQDGKLCSPNELSKYDLSANIYGDNDRPKEAYEVLGFLKGNEDITEAAIDLVESMTTTNKKILFNQLARELHYKIVKDDVSTDGIDSSNETFTPDDIFSDEFPIRRIRNLDSLIKHVREQFFCADPVHYQQVLRQIRTSKDSVSARAYAIGMYSNKDGVPVCQMCKKPITKTSPEIREIANFGIEMDQLHLCLCRECAAIYNSEKVKAPEEFKEHIKDNLMFIDLDSEDDDCVEYFLNDDCSIYFTHTHLAEVQEIFELLDDNGTPSKNGQSTNFIAVDSHNDNSEIKKSNQKPALQVVRMDRAERGTASSEKIDFLAKRVEYKNSSKVLRGSNVVFKNLTSGRNISVKIDDTKYALHKASIGKKIGDSVFQGATEYQIMDIK